MSLLFPVPAYDAVHNYLIKKLRLRIFRGLLDRKMKVLISQ